MSSLAIAALTFACTFAGALVGLRLHRRLPEGHRNDDSKDVVRLVMGLVATIAALVLGLLISSAHRNYESQQSEVQEIAVDLFQLDRALARFGPDAKEARDLLHRIVRVEVDRGSRPGGIADAIDAPLEAQQAAAVLFERISALQAQGEAQKFIQTRSLQLLGQLSNTRLLLSQQARHTIAWPFLVILVFWLTMLFVGFGLFARNNATLVVSLFVGSLSVAGAIFLILEMNTPYSGIMQVSIEPIRRVLALMTP